MATLLQRARVRRPARTPAPALSPEAAAGRTRRRARAWGMLLVAALLYCIYALSNSGRLHIVDEASLFAVTESIGLRGQVDTNAIAWTQWVNSPGEVLGAFGPTGEVYSKKGPAPSFVAVPWYLFLRVLNALDIQAGALQGTLLWNGFVTAATAVLLWLTAVRLGARERTGAALALLFGLATIAWPYARLFFGEPLSAFALLLCFSGILHWRASGQWRWVLAAGVGAGVAVATVTAHAVLVAVLGAWALFALWQRRGDGWRGLALAAGAFAAPVLVAGGLLLAYNAIRFGSPFATGYHFDSGEGFTTPIWQGAWGLLFSPYRSVFLHTPLFVASVAAFVPFFRRHRAEAVVIGALSLALIGLYSTWWMWWGGYAWGPRFLVPLTPFWVLLLLPLVEGLVLRDRSLWQPMPGQNRGAFALEWVLVVAALLSLGVQLLAVAFNFVNYETLLRSEFFATDWSDPLLFGPPAQAFGDFFLSPVFGQLRLMFRGGLAANSDVAWLWPDGRVTWMLLIVGLAALATLLWLLARWWQGQEAAAAPPLEGDLPWTDDRRARERLPAPPTVALVIAIPLILTGTWLGALGRDPIYGTAGLGYRAVLEELCTDDRPGDALVNVAPYAYHIPMNWLAALCGRALPVYGYALDSLAHAETGQVLARVLAERERIFFVTAGVAPNDPDNTLERWLAANAFKADDRWFDDHRLLRYATPGALEGIEPMTHSLFLSEGAGAGGSSVTILSSRAPGAAQAGAILPVEIRYELESAPAADLRWFVQLLAPNGVAVAQLDTGPDDNYTPFTALPLGETLVERAGLQLPAALEPGVYQVIAGLYNPAAPGAPRLRASDGREFLVLSTLTVTE